MARSVLEMSDEELLNFDPAQLLEVEEETTPPVTTPPVTGAQDDAVVAGDAGDGGVVTGEEEEENPPGEDEGNQGDGSETEGVEAAGKALPQGTEKLPAAPAATADKPADEGLQTPVADPDYKAAYERIFAPFKANGKEIRLESPDDVIALMQMGANYQKKMQAIKPNLKVLKLLENNGLLDENKLSFLIDLDKKNPAAVAKLVKDSGVDPLDMDEKAGEYQATQYSVDDRELALDSVLQDISDSEHYQRMLNVVGKEWDRKSKQLVTDNPNVLRVINSHMQSGIYDLVSGTVERERMLGRLVGLSDLEAYQQVGDAIHQRGGFAHLGAQGQQTPPVKKTESPTTNKPDPKQVKDMKRAASPTKTAPASAGKKADFNPLSLSDEEFSKLAQPRF